MARPTLLFRHGAARRFSRHVTRRRLLHHRMHATTPVRFLRRLNLLPELVVDEPPEGEWYEWDVDSSPDVSNVANEVPALRLESEGEPGTTQSLEVGPEPPHHARALLVTHRTPEHRRVSAVPKRDAPRIEDVPAPRPPSQRSASAAATTAISQSRTPSTVPALPDVDESVPMLPEVVLLPDVPTPIDAAVTAAVPHQIAEPDVVLASAVTLVAAEQPREEAAAEQPREEVAAKQPREAIALTSPAPHAPPAANRDHVELRPSAPASPAAESPVPPHDATVAPDVLSVELPRADVSRADAALEEVTSAAVVSAPPDDVFSVELPRADVSRADATVAEVASAAVVSAPPESPVTAAEPLPAPTPDPLPVRTPDPLPVPPPHVARRARVEEIRFEPSPPSRPKVGTPRVRTTDRKPGHGDSPSPEPAEREGDKLFQPVEGVDLSPAAWAARLARSVGARPEQRPARRVDAAAMSRASRDAATPAPSGRRAARAEDRRPESARPHDLVTADVRPAISPATRRFVTPIAGVDPDSVAIVQGPVASAVVSAAHADAVAIGGDVIAVAPDFTGETPRDRALLAHELTHIALRRQPRFVPPVVRGDRQRTALLDEEALALRVESEAIGLARTSPVVAASTPAPVPAHSAPDPRGIDASGRVDALAPVGAVASGDASTPPAMTEEPSTAGIAEPQPPADVTAWGGLPAPWEPLPDWFVSAPTGESADGASADNLSIDSHGVESGDAPGEAVAVALATAPAGAVHAADEGRHVEAPPAPADAGPHEESKAAAPDLDLLARQVYAVLKRRLEAETRREQMF